MLLPGFEPGLLNGSAAFSLVLGCVSTKRVDVETAQPLLVELFVLRASRASGRRSEAVRKRSRESPVSWTGLDYRSPY